MIREHLQELIGKALRDSGFEISERVQLEHPERADHGDYATSVAFMLAKQRKKNPHEIAQTLAESIKKNASDIVKDVQAVGAFVNFFITKEALALELQQAVKQKEKYGRGARLKGKKVMIEFTDPNPFKEFHIGHLYSNAVGEALARLAEAEGATLKRVNYQGDVGLHVAKAIWGMKNALNHKMPKDSASLEEKAKWLGMCYAAGALQYEIDEENKKEIVALNKKIFVLDKEVADLYKNGRKWSLEKFDKIYKRLGTKFDKFYFESDSGKKGLEIVKEYLQKGIFQESEGAVIFPGEKYGLHNRVFINSQGLPTYEAKELGLAPAKYKDFKYDQSIIVTGNEVNEYFKVLLQAMKLVFPELGEKTLHLSHGMVRLPEGKMSSRTGNVITGEDLLDEVKKRALALDSEFSEKDREEIAEVVAVAAVKYSLLRVTLGRDIIFDFEKSLSLEGDSGPYLLYTYARCKSILRKEKANAKISLPEEISKEELQLLRTTYRFPEVVEAAALAHAPSFLCAFAFDLAQTYNSFYNTNRVLDADSKEQKEFRLLLTAATAQILQNALNLLGIKTVEKM